MAAAAAERWGAARPVFVRSSATHVFWSDEVVLRMRPAPDDRFVAAARQARGLWEAGAPMVEPLLSVPGSVVEVVDGYVVSALERARGEVLDYGDVDTAVARQWGSLVAQFHVATGLCHGDPEVDNVIWGAGGPVLVDYDDVGPGEFAADVAFALRDWPVHDPIVAAFIRGYREVKPFSTEEIESLAAHRRRADTATVDGIRAILTDTPDPAWPAWAQTLDAKLRGRAAHAQRGAH